MNGALRPVSGGARARYDGGAIALFLVDAAAYLLCVGATVALRPWSAKLAFSALAGCFITRLFVLGHDACHGSLLGSRAWNQRIGRLAFLPSLTPYNLWELGHNTIHHGYTNLKGRDYVWTPLSKAEFDALPPVRRALERVYRSVFGHGLYYLVEIWWKKMMRPEKRWAGQRRFDGRDRTLVAAYALGAFAAVSAAAAATGQSVLGLAAAAILVPFFVWCEIMGLFIFLHHTHPAVAWFDKRAEWRSRPIQLEQTVHVAFPPAVDRFFHHIMDHTAHHLDPTIPLFRLHAAQASVEAACGEGIAAERFSWRYLRRCVAVCKLYDYQRHCWLDLEGNVSAHAALPGSAGGGS